MLGVVNEPSPCSNGRATDLSPVVFATFSIRRQAMADKSASRVVGNVSTDKRKGTE
ncbi:Hypothetical protein I595_451 [Croceitalea dokdonensis DOKDO 023]|uniref:Uncharacterized protein n=1 Tax=Croceitalea dokdonensis DOKDO 023 TaxID=1300341 RepID=A0A0N8H4J5_9FLAO|nr:Hypothetical protein I595_451 [Croceitalea dokdonensis DOKDO 023]